MIRKSLQIIALLAALVSSGMAEWKQESFPVKGGWNAIYPFIDASHVPLDELLESYPQVVEIWRWQPQRRDARAIDLGNIPESGIEWAVWRRGDPTNSTFSRLRPNFGYLIKVEGADFTLGLKGRAVQPRVFWRNDGLNLVGFPAKRSSSLDFSSYLEPFLPALGNVDIRKYVGGELGVSNPRKVAPNLDSIERGKAYWIQASEFSRYYGPLEIAVQQGDSLDFGSQSNRLKVKFTNLTDEPLPVTLSLEDSADPPVEPGFVGPVVLSARPADADSPADLGEPLPFTVPANNSMLVEFEPDRQAMGGSAGQRYSSVLKIATDDQEIFLGVSAEKSSLAGLWVGTAMIDQVASVRKRYQRDAEGNTVYEQKTIDLGDGNEVTVPGAPKLEEDFTTPEDDEELPHTDRNYPLRLLVHVDSNGNATLLSHVYQGILASEVTGNQVGLTLDESRLAPADLDSARRLSVAHLPLDTTARFSPEFGPGSVNTTTVNVAHDDPDNPFIHAYHPDHDNLNSRFDGSLGADAKDAESYGITRTVRLQVDATGEGPAWGNSLLTGIYREDIDGVHKDTLRSRGIFALRKVSNIPEIPEITE